jgi:hypothetical protein
VGHPRDRDRLLDRAGHAEQRRQRIGVGGRGDEGVDRIGLRAGVVVAVGDDRVDLRMRALELLDVRLNDVARARLARSDRVGELPRRTLDEGTTWREDGHRRKLHGGRRDRRTQPLG